MMDNVQVERWTFQPWHGGFWWCTSTDMTITVWWFELIILGGRLTRLTLLFLVFWYSGLPRLEKDAQARDGTENVWTCTNSQTDLRPVSFGPKTNFRCVADSGRVLATSRYSQRIWTWATAGPYLQTLCIWLMCASTRSSGRRVLAEIFYPVSP